MSNQVIGETKVVKPWCCENGHVMGYVMRNGRGVRQLILLRVAIDPSNPQDAPDVMAVVEGYAADICCSICGSVRTWVPGEEALRQLLNRCMRKELVAQFFLLHDDHFPEKQGV